MCVNRSNRQHAIDLVHSRRDLEWNIFVSNSCFLMDVFRLLGALVHARSASGNSAAGAWLSFTVATATQQYKIVGNNFGAIFFLAALLVFPTGSLEPAFNIDLGAFLYVLAHDLSQPLPGNNIVPFRTVLPFPAFIFVALVSRQAELRYGNTAGCVFNFRIFAEISNENDFVYAFRHESLIPLKSVWLLYQRRRISESSGSNMRAVNLVEHYIHHHAGDRNIEPDRICPPGNPSMAIESTTQPIAQRKQDH